MISSIVKGIKGDDAKTDDNNDSKADKEKIGEDNTDGNQVENNKGVNSQTNDDKKGSIESDTKDNKGDNSTADAGGDSKTVIEKVKRPSKRLSATKNQNRRVSQSKR